MSNPTEKASEPVFTEPEQEWWAELPLDGSIGQIFTDSRQLTKGGRLIRVREVAFDLRPAPTQEEPSFDLQTLEGRKAAWQWLVRRFELIVTKDGVPFEDQAEGIRQFKQAAIAPAPTQEPWTADHTFLISPSGERWRIPHALQIRDAINAAFAAERAKVGRLAAGVKDIAEKRVLVMEGETTAISMCKALWRLLAELEGKDV